MSKRVLPSKSSQISASVFDEEPIDDLDEALEVIPYDYTITAYGADYPVDSLVKRIQAADILVPQFSWAPDQESEVVGFQREYVWPRRKADRFIESLLLGLPVPGIFLVKEQSGRLLVLDGHQRLFSLSAYYKGVIHGIEYRLDGVQERYRGRKYEDLEIEDRRRLDDSIIHATVIRQDVPTDDQSSVYMIFERLNTGGINLQPQEIRVALYHGKLVGVLQALNEEPAWRSLYGKKSRRLKDMEMILRFLAFYYHQDQYRSPMKDFLNRYMASNRDLERQSATDLGDVFRSVVTLLAETVGPRAFRPVRAVNAAAIDSIMTGIAMRVATGPIKRKATVSDCYDRLIGNRAFLDAINTGTSQEANVSTRLRLAANTFSRVK